MDEHDENFERAKFRAESILSIVAIVISFISIICSIVVALYEFKKDHEPNLKLWDQEFVCEYKTDSHIDDLIALSFGNIGDGIAQNFKFRITLENQKKVVSQCEKRLDSLGLCKWCESHIPSRFFYYSYISNELDFSFHYKNKKFESVSIDKKNETIYNSFKKNYVKKLNCILPITINESLYKIELPSDLSILILNTLCLEAQKTDNLENIKPIILNAEVDYSDITENNNNNNTKKVKITIGVVENSQIFLSDNDIELTDNDITNDDSTENWSITYSVKCKEITD